MSSERLSQSAALVDDLGANSLMLVELTLALEERFGITIRNDDTVNLHTVADVIGYIEASRGLFKGEKKDELSR